MHSISVSFAWGLRGTRTSCAKISTMRVSSLTPSKQLNVLPLPLLDPTCPTSLQYTSNIPQVRRLIIDYTCVSSIHKVLSSPSAMLLSKDDPERYVAGLPVVSFHFTDEFRKEYPQVKQASVSTLLRVKGWILPNYPLPPNEERTEILRAVIRESFSASKPPSPVPRHRLSS